MAELDVQTYVLYSLAVSLPRCVMIFILFLGAKYPGTTEIQSHMQVGRSQARLRSQCRSRAIHQRRGGSGEQDAHLTLRLEIDALRVEISHVLSTASLVLN